jgi:hypothetical protein
VRGGEEAGFDEARRARVAVGAGRRLGETEVEDLRLLAVGDEDVGGLDVAVQDAARVRGVDRVGNLRGQPQQQADIERTAVDRARERAPLEQLHRDERPPLVLVHLIDGADVRVVQRRGGARFAQEALHRLRLVGAILRQELERHLARELHVFGEIDHAHAARAERVEDAIVRDGLADHGAEGLSLDGRCGSVN